VERGADADLIVIDVNAPSMRPRSNLKKSAVFAADISCVKTTVAGGKIIYDDGDYFVGEDAEKIYANAEKCIKRLLKQANM